MLIPSRLLPLNYQAKYFLDSIPCAIAIWRADGLVCVLNELTLRLTGYSAQEFQETPSSLWISRIHPSDASVFFAARKRLETGEDSVSCDYRFLPKGRHQERWLNETCRKFQNGGLENTEIISVYSDVSHVVALPAIIEAENRIGRVRQVIEQIGHEITNNLQVIRGTFDYFSRRGLGSKEHRQVEARIEQTSQLIEDLSEYFYLPACDAIDADPAVMLRELAHGTQNDLLRHGIRLEVVQQGPLLPTRIEPAEFRKAFDKIFEFMRVLIPNGGQLKIDACLRELEGEGFLELTISSPSTTCIPVEADNVFRPFLKIRGQSVGLSMIMAQEILRRHGGKIVFETAPTAAIRILLRTREDRLA